MNDTFSPDVHKKLKYLRFRQSSPDFHPGKSQNEEVHFRHPHLHLIGRPKGGSKGGKGSKGGNNGSTDCFSENTLFLQNSLPQTVTSPQDCQAICRQTRKWGIRKIHGHTDTRTLYMDPLFSINFWKLEKYTDPLEKYTDPWILYISHTYTDLRKSTRSKLKFVLFGPLCKPEIHQISNLSSQIWPKLEFPHSEVP